jgi:hypothetical protein
MGDDGTAATTTSTGKSVRSAILVVGLGAGPHPVSQPSDRKRSQTEPEQPVVVGSLSGAPEAGGTVKCSLAAKPRVQMPQVSCGYQPSVRDEPPTSPMPK